MSMPVLLYCAADYTRSRVPPEAGVAGQPMRRMEFSGLAIYCSEVTPQSLATQEALRESALQFHQVLQKIFTLSAILPFRFPTLLNSETEMTEYLEQHSAEYKSLLQKFEGTVQMEALISYSAEGQIVKTGTEYLRNRQNRHHASEQLLSQLQSAVNGIVCQWRFRSSQNIVRCFALVKRADVGEFNNCLRPVRVPEGLQVRVSGPWPATEFFGPALASPAGK